MRSLVVIAAVVAFASTFSSCGESAAHTIALANNAVWEGELDFENGGRLDFSLQLPSDAVVARVTLISDVFELELHAQPHKRIRDVYSAPYDASGYDGPPTLMLDRLGEDRVAGAKWFFTVHWPYDDVPRVGNQRVPRADVALEVETFVTRVDAELAPGEPMASALDEPSGGFRTFKITVPSTANVLRLDLFDVSSNFDLYARHGGPLFCFDDDVAFAEHGWGHETLVIDAQSEPPLRAGDWYIDVVDAIGPTRTLPFRILASFDSGVPEPLRSLPVLAPFQGAGGLERAVRAVVEVTTADGAGSGTLLTRDGWILTNAHVIGEQENPEIVVALTLDPTLPAEEMFRARLARIDFERDLGLIRIVSGLYGQPIPDGYEFPTLELGQAERLSIGAPLWLVGYPTTGGTGSRVTINATRGIVAGFERADFGVLIKTDAEITQGNSGGAALDESGSLVGVPSSTVENGSGQIGYVHPIEALPAAWRKMIGL